MNKKNIVIIASLFSLLLIINIVNASCFQSNLQKKNNTLKIQDFSKIDTTFNQKDRLRCTCGGEVCSGYFETHPKASIGGWIEYCALTCSCKKNIGFQYETEN